jgi:thiamine-phosphate pyrophosphorylase
MTTTPYTGAAALAREAAKIAKASPQSTPGLPPLIVLTDPERLPDPIALASHLPGPCALIYRHFGDPNARRISAKASAICKDRGLSFLVSCDSGVPPGPDTGVHFPQIRHGAIADWRAAMPGHIFTAAAHSEAAVHAAFAAGANAVLLSPVFATDCDGANPALGLDAFTRIAKTAPGPVYALGGIHANNAQDLRGHAAGLAVVSAILT